MQVVGSKLIQVKREIGETLRIVNIVVDKNPSDASKYQVRGEPPCLLPILPKSPLSMSFISSLGIGCPVKLQLLSMFCFFVATQKWTNRASVQKTGPGLFFLPDTSDLVCR